MVLAPASFAPTTAQKPRRWMVSQGLVDSRWAWAWKGLLVCFPLWEGGGTTVYDLAAPARTGVLTSFPAAAWSRGEIGVAPTFDGTNDHIRIANTDGLTTPTQGTIAVGCQITSDTGDANFAMSFARNADANRSEITMGINMAGANNRFETTCRDNGVIQYNFGTPNGSATDYINKHANMLVSQDGVSGVTLYIQGGTLVAKSTNLAWLDDIFAGANPADVFTIGANRRNGGTESEFTGLIQYLYIWNWPLGPGEAAALSRDPFGFLRPIQEIRNVEVGGGRSAFAPRKKRERREGRLRGR